MCKKCKAIADEQNALFEEMDANELVKMLAILRGIEDVSIFEREWLQHLILSPSLKSQLRL